MIRYYYLKDKAGHPVITVTILKFSNEYARGIAICSPKDQFSRKTGREISGGRAVSAWVARGHIDRLTIDGPVVNVLSRVAGSLQKLIALCSDILSSGDGFHMGIYNPRLTSYEKHILGDI